MLDKRRVISFCSGLLNRGIRTKFTVTGRFNIVDSDILAALRDAGCITVFYGGESAPQNILDQMKKKTTVEQMSEGVQLTRSYGIFTRVGMMFGQPNETREDLLTSVKFLQGIAYGHFESRYIYGCIPFPATELFDHCVTSGLLSGDEDLLRRFEFKPRLLDQIPVNMTSIIDTSPMQLLNEANRELQLFYDARSSEWLSYLRSAAATPGVLRRPALAG